MNDQFEMQFWVVSVLAVVLLTGAVVAQETQEGNQDNERMEQLESEIEGLKVETETVRSRISDYATEGSVAFLAGAVCALWAKNSGRNAWIWFFWGAILMPITILVMLHENAKDIDQSKSA